MESIQSKLLKTVLRIARLNKMWKLTGNELRNYVEKKQMADSPEPPKEIQRKYDISVEEMNGYRYYVMKPGKAIGHKHIFSLFIGTHDILYPDAKRLKRLADEKGLKINYFEYPSMIHIWPLFFFPESQKAREQIIDIIL